MNGQQLTNSSNSANETPSSSYPASLSSQSSRDPSPATRSGGPPKLYPESYNHVISTQANHWPKDKGQLTNSFPSLVNHSTPVSSPPISSGKPAQILDSRALHAPMAQPAGGLPNPPRPFSPAVSQPHRTLLSSSHPLYRFPPPTSLPQPVAPLPLNNHLPTTQPTNVGNQYSAPVRPPNSSQTSQPPQPSQAPDTKPAESMTQPSFPPTSANQVQPPSNQFQSLSSTPFQQPLKQPQNLMPASGQAPQQPNHQFSSNVTPPLHNQLPQNKSVNLPNQTSQPPHQFVTSQNQLPQPQNQFPQSQIQFPQKQNQIPQPQNQFPQPQNQFPQPPQNSFPQQGQFPQHQNKYPQTPNQFYQNPAAQLGQPPNQYPRPPAPQMTQQNQQQYQGANYAQSQQNQFNLRYPQMAPQPGFHHHPGSMDGLNSAMAGMSVNQGFNKLWGMDAVDLLKCRDLLPDDKIEPPSVRLQHELYEAANCSPEIFRCTLTKIPETKSLLDKSRLPLGVLIHPFKDLNQLSVIQCTVIVRCRMCRTYINPFVYFVDNKRWKCNLCFRVNELPDEFQFDPMTKTYGDPSRRPEIKSATIEFIAPSEYMVRPPQPATYVFVLDVSRLACECGYLYTVCQTLLAELDNVPGDARTSVAFITFDSAVHFYSLTEGQGQPHQMIVVDIDDMFLPTPENLLVSINDCRDLIRDLLQEIPDKFRESYDTHSALGAALQAAYKLLAPTGGRVTVFQACLPNMGPGALTAREDPSQRAGDNPPHLNPSTDFYKKLALDCSGQQIAVDLFLVNSQYLDLATLSGISRFSGGCIHHVPLFRSDKPLLVESLERMFQRYLIRKIGFESVMRLRCTRGLSIHTFHGNFFVRSTDLLSLPNANPDAGFGMQVTIDENLTEVQNVCFQAALLYTSSKGERRIRVHTLCLPVASTLPDILHSADQQCIVALLAKMAVDRAIQSSLSDAREAFVNVVADILSAYRLTQSGNMAGSVVAPASLALLPLYILALLKHVSFRVGQSTRLDDRVFAMCQMKSLPLTFLMQAIYPDLYSLLHTDQRPEIEVGDRTVTVPPRLQLSAERIDSHGLFLMDDGAVLLMYVGHNLDPAVCQQVFDVPHVSAIPQELYSLPELENPVSTALRNFISYLQNEKPYPTPLQVIRDDSHHRAKFIERLIEDKNESGTSYYEFIQRVKALVK